jgi:alanine dehydrogenase
LAEEHKGRLILFCAGGTSMIIGVPREIKNNEFRVALQPAGARLLVEQGHRVLVQAGAGTGAGFGDSEYRTAGAYILPAAGDVYRRAELIVKVKEPLPPEYALLQRQQVVFTFLHLAASRTLTAALIEKEITGIAYETVQTADGTLPLLSPMSEIAGKLSVQIGAHYLEKPHGGSGVLLGGAAGLSPGRVAVLGGGTVGKNAAAIALGMGAEVTLLDINPDILKQHPLTANHRLTILNSNRETIAAAVAGADLVIGAVLVPGASAPKLVTQAMIARMRAGSVMVDVAIDQGGCFETSYPTSLDDPVFMVEGVIQYCVTNVPALVSRTATLALSETVFPYVLKLANMGYKEALRQDRALLKGLNTYQGKITNQAVAEAAGRAYTRADLLI